LHLFVLRLTKWKDRQAERDFKLKLKTFWFSSFIYLIFFF